MKALLAGVAGVWENSLRDLVGRRGHLISVVNDIRNIEARLADADHELVFVGMDWADDETIELCRQLRARRGLKPLAILACGAAPGHDKAQALLSARIDDCLTDPQNHAELEFRLALAESRVSGRAVSDAAQVPNIGQYRKDDSFAAAPKGFFRSSLEGKVLDVDQSLVDMLGYESREEAMRIDIARDFYFDPSMRRKLLTDLSAENKTHEFFCKRRDGRPLAIRATWRRVFDDAGKFLYFEGAIQDISASARDPNLLRIQCDLASKLCDTSDVQRTLNEVLASAVQIEGIDCGGIYLFNDSSGNFELATSKGIPDWLVKTVPLYSLDEPQMRSMVLGKPFYLTVEEMRHPSRAALEKTGIKAGVIAPIMHQGQVVATLNLASHTHNAILPSSRAAIEAITAQIGGSVARARLEAARQIGRQNLQSLFDTLQDMVFVLDRSGKVLYANQMAWKRLGYSAADLLKMEIADLHPPERRQELLALFSKVLTGEASICNIPFLTKQGDHIPVEILGARGKWGENEAVFGIARDLSEGQRVRLALYESESRFQAIFESAAVGLALGNLQGIMVLVNATFAKMLGYAPEELAGKGYNEFTHPDDVRAQKTILEELFRGERDKIVLEKRYIHRDGGIIWGRLNVSLIHDADGAPIYGIAIIENITEKKQSAEAIQKEQQLLRRIIDLHERDRQITAYEIHDGMAQQVAAALLHLGAFRRLRDCDAIAAEQSLDAASKLMSQCADEARRLISGLRPLVLDEYGIVEAIDYLVCENRERSGMRIDFLHDVRFKRLAPPLESAAFRIVQEALANACRHGQSEIVIVELTQSEDRLHIKVRDQGPGFDPSAVGESCFGLRSIRERARLLGGRAEIESAPGSPTVVNVELPVVLQAEEQD